MRRGECFCIPPIHAYMLTYLQYTRMKFEMKFWKFFEKLKYWGLRGVWGLGSGVVWVKTVTTKQHFFLRVGRRFKISDIFIFRSKTRMCCIKNLGAGAASCRSFDVLTRHAAGTTVLQYSSVFQNFQKFISLCCCKYCGKYYWNAFAFCFQESPLPSS